MEASLFEARMTEALKNKTFLKLIFQYPASDRAVIKRGTVTAVSDIAFNFEEIRDGLVTYSYQYLVEVKDEVKRE